MNREDAHEAKEEKEKDTVLPSRSSANAPRNASSRFNHSDATGFGMMGQTITNN
jgi:hypothetical protein